MLKQLEMQQMPEDERMNIFYTQMQTKRTILACVEAIPTAIAWTLTTILLVNVSKPLIVNLNRGATAAQ